jgi:hypothetical protein
MLWDVTEIIRYKLELRSGVFFYNRYIFFCECFTLNIIEHFELNEKMKEICDTKILFYFPWQWGGRGRFDSSFRCLGFR